MGKGSGAPDVFTNPLIFIVMEFLAGKNIRRILNEEEKIAPKRAIKIISKAAEALHYAHKHNIIHRDIKPPNFLILPDNTLKLLDFGIAKNLEETGLTLTGFLVGTAGYIAPEQLTGQPITPATDIFCLGIVLYEILTGQKPFSGPRPDINNYKIVYEEPPLLKQVGRDYSKRLNGLIIRMLRKEPKQRPRSMQDVIHQLEMI